MQISLTQSGVYVALIGYILNLAGVKISTEEITKAVEAVLVIAGLVIAWYGRFRQGDLTIWGTRK